MQLVSLLAGQGSTCVDVGANKGTWTERMRQVVGKTGQVLSIEPQRQLSMYLQIGFGHRENVEVHDCAVSVRSGTRELKVPLRDGRAVSGHATFGPTPPDAITEKVRVETLDELVGERCPDFIKIDVEGHELEVIEGSLRTIANRLPPMIIEMMPGGPVSATAQCFRLLTETYGYQAGVMRERGVLPITDWPNWEDRPSPNIIFAQDLPSTSS